MNPDHADPHAVLLATLRRIGSLDTADADAITKLPMRVTPKRNGAIVVQNGNTITECAVLLDGYACRHKIASNGGRQIVSFHMPGDILDLQHLWLPRADHTVELISRATVAFVPVDVLRSLCEARPASHSAMAHFAYRRVDLPRMGTKCRSPRCEDPSCAYAMRVRDPAYSGWP